MCCFKFGCGYGCRCNRCCLDCGGFGCGCDSNSCGNNNYGNNSCGCGNSGRGCGNNSNSCGCRDICVGARRQAYCEGFRNGYWQGLNDASWSRSGSLPQPRAAEAESDGCGCEN